MSTNSANVYPAKQARPSLQKIQAIHNEEISGTTKKLNRGISRATGNVNLVSKARNEFALDFRELGVNEHKQYFVETPIYTFTLPDLTIYSDEFRAFLEKDLIEMSTLIALEQAGRLNWWTRNAFCQRLWPLATTGDGNCLLHAASLGMWGFHDRLLTLRKALFATLSYGTYRNALWRRWRWQQTIMNNQAGLVYSEQEWQNEWQNILRMSSTEPRAQHARRFSCSSISSGKGVIGSQDIYESLEEIHVLALAHVLRRPIVVIADTVLKDASGQPFAPIPFGGIYLPLECPPNECHRSPLVLTYDAAHFSALVAMQTESGGDKNEAIPPALIPLTGPDNQLLPVQFVVDPGSDVCWNTVTVDGCNEMVWNHKELLSILHEYLDVIKLHIDEVEPLSAENSDVNLPKVRASKQLQSVAKQFGSVGRSMGRKLKKNLSRLGRSNSLKETSNKHETNVELTSHSQCSTPQIHRRHRRGEVILAAILHTEKRHEYQEEMIRNYLDTARERFEREMKYEDNQAELVDDGDGNNTDGYNCALFASLDSLGKHYKAKAKTKLSSTLALYGTGKSHFYAESDLDMFSRVVHMPVSSRPLSNRDQTLYLSKSTFFKDNKSLVGVNGSCSHLCSSSDCKYFENKTINLLCAHCLKQQHQTDNVQSNIDLPSTNYVLQLKTTHI